MVVIAFVVPLGLLVRNQARDRALAAAQRDAQSVASGLLVASSLSGIADTGELAAFVIEASGSPAGVSIVSSDGTTAGAPLAEFPDALNRARAGAAFTVTTDDGATVYVPVTGAGGTAVVVATVPGSELRQGVYAAWILLGVLGLLLVAAAVAVGDRLGRAVVRPVGDLAAAARRLGEGDLTTRVQPAGPHEVVEVGVSFNYLADRLDDLLAAERESVADLSHRLRTPLTALRLQAETLDDREAARAMLADIDRLEDRVDEIITEARQRRRDDRPRRSDLAAVTRHRAAFWQVLTEEEGRPFPVDIPEREIWVGIPDADLGAVLDVLLENVFAHTPPGTPLSVRVTGDDATATLSVSDLGPGIDQSALARGKSGSGSTGLGLDIARRTAERAGGRVIVSAGAGGGTTVAISVPLLDR